jgi:large subunit ribosomal protein L21e
MKDLEEGEKVLIDYHPSVQDGRQHHRFHSRSATVTGFRGEAVELEVSDGKKTKTLYLKPVHISKLGDE